MPEKHYKDFVNGNMRGFEELVREFREPVTRFVYRFVPRWEAAEDIAQDVFVEVLEKRGFRFRSSFRSWLFAIARHKAIDYIRKNSRIMPLGEIEHDEGAAGPEEQVLARERRRQAAAALAQLKDDRRMALLLTAAQGLSYEEAAAALHTTPDRIKNLCHRGRQQLRNAMKEVENNDGY